MSRVIPSLPLRPARAAAHRRRRFVAMAVLAIVAGLPVAPVSLVAAADPPKPFETPVLLGDGGGVTKAAQTAGIAPSGFTDQTIFSGLTNPTSVRFASDGRIFVAQKGGQILIYDNLTDTTPTLFADFSTATYDYWDRGLLGMTLAPNFPTSPYVYALYAYDAPIGGTAPVFNDACASPTTNGCVISARLSRFQASGNTAVAETVLVNDWCQQYPSHSIGELRFGPDGALYVSGGDGASFTQADYGQMGSPKNPCGDPPGGSMAPPSARGGALRSQSLQRPAGDPVSLDGAILRLDPATGAAMSGNPLIGNSNANAKRIVAYGARNPFRFNFRPGTNEIWFGDVGYNTWEEINRVTNPLSSTVANFGWPCFEGAGHQSEYEAQGLTICSNLYASNAVVAPYYTYNHGNNIVSGETCSTGSSAIAGLAFYQNGTYGAAYQNGLFFTDHARNCIWLMKAGTNGLPDPAQISVFVSGASNPVQLETGPGGDLFYVDFDGGTIHRIVRTGANGSPTAVIAATPSTGAAPLTVNFDGTGSTDPEGDTLTYAWDLDGNGQYNDSTASKPSWTYASPGNVTVGLKVTDTSSNTGTTTKTITVTNSALQAVIDTPATSLTWAVGDPINFSGHASNASGPLPASAMSWTLILNHCPSNCHTHTVQTWSGVASGSFTAPDHDYPSNLDLILTVTDGAQQTTSTVRLNPKTVNISFASVPSGATLAVGSYPSAVTPFTQTVIKGNNLGMAAPATQTIGSTVYQFQSWSDGGAASHSVTANAAATYTATYAATGGTTSYLSDLAWTQTANGWGPVEKDRSNGEASQGDGLPITLNGVVYSKGLGAHAASDVRYAMGGTCTSFSVSVGLDDEVLTNGSAIFTILADGVQLWTSGVMTGASATQATTVNVTGRSQLQLTIGINGVADYDHGDWADAKLTCG